jgi:glycosyltransferase involved in cell wall biosynthesis
MDAAVGVSQRSLDEMIQHYSFKKPSVCIPRAINIDHFANYIPELDVRQKVGIPETAFVLLFLGNFTHQKRPDRFLEIIHGLKKDIPHVHGLMVGDGPLRSSVNDQILTLSLENNITCVGYKKDVRPWIAMSDLLLLTSDTEGMPGVVLEAAAMKKITITGNVGGVAEFIKNGITGFIVDWQILEKEILVKIILDNQNIKINVENAFLTLKKNFDLYFISKKYFNFFELNITKKV